MLEQLSVAGIENKMIVMLPYVWIEGQLAKRHNRSIETIG